MKFCANIRKDLVKMAREPLSKSSGKQALRFGMGCKAQTAVIAEAIARICNAAERPNP